MGLAFVLGFITMTVKWGECTPTGQVVDPGGLQSTDELNDTELDLAFVVFRHGDRTPDEEELALNPIPAEEQRDVFFPYGKKALTNKGKQRAFCVGKYLRKRYNGFLSQLYLPDEIVIRTTDYGRTKMTALVALAALYPPPPTQRWNPTLNWQPIPYNTIYFDDDDLIYYYNCPRYNFLRYQVYNYPEIKRRMLPYEGLYEYLQKHTGTNITTPESVFLLDSLFQTLENVGLQTPKWAQEVMPQIREVTKIEYASQFYTRELIQLAAGVFTEGLVNATSAYIAGDREQPKVRLFSAHENNVAAIMAAVGVFKPHQPKYGATFSIELRTETATGKYKIAAVYSPDAGGPGYVLPISGCGEGPLCDYDIFLTLVNDILLSKPEYDHLCTVVS